MSYQNSLTVKYELPDGAVETVENLTLAEESSGQVYTENELADEDTSSRREGSLISAEGCEVIGIIGFSEDDLEKIDPDRISETPENCLFLSDVEFAEQREADAVYVKFDEGESFTLSGIFDRAYTY